MAKACTHLRTIREVVPSALGCEECLKIGQAWVHLRLCRTCGHVGCCDESAGRHASGHFRATCHPIIEGYDPPEGWGWCYVDQVMFDLSDDRTPHPGPIPRHSRGTVSAPADGGRRIPRWRAAAIRPLSTRSAFSRPFSIASSATRRSANSTGRRISNAIFCASAWLSGRTARKTRDRVLPR
jgi:Zn-finger in ubiquitin-hydrolases and other protein